MIYRLMVAGLALALAAAISAGQAREEGSAPQQRGQATTTAAAENAGEEFEIAKRRRRYYRRHRRHTVPHPSPKPEQSNGEVLFGVQDVGFRVDRDIIPVGPKIGKFERVRLRVLKNDIDIVDLKAVYANGDFETLLTDAKLRRNRKTDWIALNRDGFLKEFRLIYRARPKFKGQARVEVFGEYKDGWLGPDGEGAKYNNGWVLLGTDTAGSVGFDRVKIPVGKNEGGFKKLRVSVKDRDVTMTKLSVVYADGDKDKLETNRIKVAADEAFGPVELNNDAAIKEILGVWRSRAIATSKRKRAYATVQVWGHH